MITSNIHGVNSIHLERIEFSTFISHKFTFETDEGTVEISAFAPVSLEVHATQARAASISQPDERRRMDGEDLLDEMRVSCDEPCQSCEGTGNDERDEGFDSRKYPCQECNGTGKKP